MARFIGPAAVLIALVGGYVVGQEQEKTSAPAKDLEPLPGEPGERVEDGLRFPYVSQGQVGRLQLAASGDTMLDTATGRLYKLNGGTWVLAGSFYGSLTEIRQRQYSWRDRRKTTRAGSYEHEYLSFMLREIDRQLEFANTIGAEEDRAPETLASPQPEGPAGRL